MVINIDWSDALCARLAKDAETQDEQNRILGLFFTDEDDDLQQTQAKQKEAKQICAECPIRLLCLKSALDAEDRFGTWGGADEGQIRKALSIDQFGHPTVRLRKMKCPNCLSTDLTQSIKKTTKTKVRCNGCDLIWWTRRKPEVTHVYVDEEQDISDGDME